MAKTISMDPQQKSDILTDNAFIQFIVKERLNIISKVNADFPGLKREHIEDIFQEICIDIVEKARKEEIKLTCSLFYYVYKCCWNKANHRIDPNLVKLQNENNIGNDDIEIQQIKPDKVDQLLDDIFDNERDKLLEKVCDAVKDLPQPCHTILYGMYGNPKKKQEVIAQELGLKNADVVKTEASRCKKKFWNRFQAIYEAYKKRL